ncbi:MAG: YqzL family protein [Bacillota bacterium]
MILFTAEFFWRLFEATGSIKAYMLYKRFALH